MVAWFLAWVEGNLERLQMNLGLEEIRTWAWWDVVGGTGEGTADEVSSTAADAFTNTFDKR